MFIVSLSCTLIILVLLNELLSWKLRICTKDTFKVNSVGQSRNPISCYLQNRIMPFACPIIKFSTLFYKIAGNQGCKLKKREQHNIVNPVYCALINHSKCTFCFNQLGGYASQRSNAKSYVTSALSEP